MARKKGSNWIDRLITRLNDPQDVSVKIIAAFLLLFETALCFMIIKKVPCEYLNQ